MTGRPGWRTYALAIGIIAGIGLLSLVMFSSSGGAILQTVSTGV